MLEKTYHLIGKLVPSGFKRHINSMLRYAGMKEEPDAWLGSAILLSILVAIIVHLLSVILKLPAVAATLLPLPAFLFVFFVYYVLLYLKVEDRRERLERSLPDALRLIAANIHAGITPLVALRVSARPEFGPLEEEINYATTKSLGTVSLESALMEISTRIRSEMLERTVSLFVTSLRSGGNLAKLLENMADDIQEGQELRRELISGTRMYIVFILFILLIGMPSLLSISIEFINMISMMQAKTESAYAQQIGLVVGTPVSSDFIYQTSLLTLVMTSVLASMLMGVINDGKKLNGLRYSPLLLAGAALSFYLIHSYVIKILLGSI